MTPSLRSLAPLPCDAQCRGRQSGNILIGVLVTVVLVLGLIFASTTVSNVEITTSRRSLNEIRAYYVAQAGVERGINFLKAAIRRTDVFEPMMGLRSLFVDGAGVKSIVPFLGEPVTDGAHRAGEFTLTMTPEELGDEGFEVQFMATGYTPWAPIHRPEGGLLAQHQAVRAVVQIREAPSQVFDNAYFINNWGWLYGDSITINGNARSNGQLDAGGYAPVINGQPRYQDVAVGILGGVQLSGYVDDNGDGLEDGNDGGSFAAWDIVGAENVRGLGGQSSNQHDFEDSVSMPNLSDLHYYEDRAILSGGSIAIGGTVYSNAVYGDEAGEKQHLFLVGTAANPVEISGSVVVRGDLLIGGVVTGQGAIYAGGNIYIPDDLTYANGPSTPRPSSNLQSDTEAWLTANWNKDFLGLFARENITVGDHTDSLWSYYVSSWMSDPLNASAEDLGEDGIANTLQGRDGVVGTVDDDVLENDGEFTVEQYSQLDADLGLIPPGLNVGDPVPGSGEDVDGDGIYDDTLTLSDLDFADPLSTSTWGGNIGSYSVSPYSNIATTSIAQLDGVFYTNHAFSMLSTATGGTTINGSLVCRNEQVIYTDALTLNYDCRMLGGGGMAAELLPRNIDRIVVMSWQIVDGDPNHDAHLRAGK